MTNDTRPIGVFDSGIGGLSVLKHLEHRLPGERFIYLGDTARVPYGNRSVETVQLYSRQCAAFLEQHNVKMIVVACNTASAVALDAVRDDTDIPVLGVIEPAAKEAVRRTRNGHIGVIGTRATIASNAYASAIATAQANAIRRSDADVRSHVQKVVVHSQPCPLFVPLVEEGWLNTSATRLVAEEYLRPLVANRIDTLVLGCTHYPLLAPMLAELLPDVALIDCGQSVTTEAIKALNDSNTVAVGDVDATRDAEGARIETDRSKMPTYFYLTDNTPQFQLIAQQFLGKAVNEPVRVSVDHLIGV